MSIDMKFHIDIGGDRIDIESFCRFRKSVIAPAPNKLGLKHVLPLFVLQIVHKFKLKCKVPLLITTLCLDVSDKIRR
jgi:hypothetical protein